MKVKTDLSRLLRLILQTRWGLWVLLCLPATAWTATPALVINGLEVPQSYLRLLSEEARKQDPVQDSADIRKSVADRLIVGTLLYQEALKEKLDQQPETADRLELIRRTTLANLFIQKYLQDHPADDKTYAQAYDALRQRMGDKFYIGRQIKVGHREEALKIIEQLNAGQSFDEILKNYDAVQKGPFPAQTANTPLGQFLAKLKDGEWGKTPFEAPDGWRVVRLDQTEDIHWQPLEAMKPNLRRTVEQMQVQGLVDSLRARASIIDNTTLQPLQQKTPAPAKSD